MTAAAEQIFRTERGRGVYGLLAEFATPADLTHACEKVRDAGYRQWDAYAPFPVHGLDEAMGLKRPLLPLVVGVIGLSGACLGFIFQMWVRHGAYALVHQGKPTDSWQVLVPVTFEIGVLFSAFTCIIGMLAFNALPRWHHPLMRSARFLRVSDDKYAIAIESRDPRFDAQATRALLEGAGATAVEVVEDA